MQVDHGHHIRLIKCPDAHGTIIGSAWNRNTPTTIFINGIWERRKSGEGSIFLMKPSSIQTVLCSLNILYIPSSQEPSALAQKALSSPLLKLEN